MTKESLAMLEAAAARVEQAIDVLEEAQEILVQDDEDMFEFPVGIIFAAQTSLRVVSELAKDVRAQSDKERRGKGGRKGARKGAAKKAGRTASRKRAR
jgi:hypothetical protein